MFNTSLIYSFPFVIFKAKRKMFYKYFDLEKYLDEMDQTFLHSPIALKIYKIFV